MAAQVSLDDAPAATRQSTPSSQPDAAHQLAHEVIVALGGMDKVKAMFDAPSLAKGRMTDFSGMSGASNTVEVDLLSRQDKFRVDLQVLGQKAITGYNGKMAWQQHGDEVFPSDPITSRKIAEDTSHGALLLLKLEDPAVRMQLLPAQMVQGKLCPGLEVFGEEANDGHDSKDSKNSKWTKLYIDPDTRMILSIEYMGMDFEQGSDALKRSEFSDYRPFAGSLIAFKSVEFTGGKKTSEQVLASVELKPGVEDSLFDMPSRKAIEGLTGAAVVIPFEYVSNEVVVKAKINDRQELRFLLDTGATQNVMEKASATTFGAIAKSDMSLTTGSGFVTMGGIVLESLQLGAVKLKDVPMAVADMPGFAQIKGGRPAGIIGANILRRFAVTVDYEQRKVYLRQPESLVVPPDATVLQAHPALGSVGLSVDGLADGKLKLRLLVDTGAAFNSISEPLLKPILDFPLLAVGSVEGVDGNKVEVGSVQLRTLGLDNVIVEEPIFSVAPGAAASKMPAGLLSASALGILGNTCWSHFRLTVDYLNGRIILEETATSKLTQSILGQARKLFAKYLKDRNSDAAIAGFDELLMQAQPSELLKVRTLVALYRARVSAEKAFASQDAWQTHNAAKAFEAPYVLAKESNDGALEAKVLSDQCLFLLDNLNNPANSAINPTNSGSLAADLQNIRHMLQMASARSESEPELLVAAGVYFSKVGSLVASGKMIDQALVQDPANWRGLVEKYEIARREAKPVEEHQVLELIHHYYPGCNPPRLSAHADASSAKSQ